MSVPLWFAVGAGGAAALWWWRYVVQKYLWEKEDGEKPVDPSVAEAMFWGTFIWAFSPLWVPIWSVHKLCTKHRIKRAWWRLTQRSHLALLRAFPDRDAA